jgi:hypothetical protein
VIETIITLIHEYYSRSRSSFVILKRRLLETNEDVVEVVIEKQS